MTDEQDETLPKWADAWLEGHCGCGARLCRPACYCGNHVACSAWAVDVEVCPEQRKEQRP